jgi:hypothetical protein
MVPGALEVAASSISRASGGVHQQQELPCFVLGVRSEDPSGTVRSTIDCIIAAIAEDGGCDLLARDRDMDAILDSGLLKAGRWQPSFPRR